MVSQTVVLNLENGLNTDEVSKIINFSRNFESTITMKHDGRIANCKSLISLINLGAVSFSEVEVATEGPNETEELERFVKFLQEMSV
ncbi:MAG: HPr family phosphocarrier protein [Defluviitaleaceae bacterium]|nr:HPr family phosphocarrier protein [Defluviitaleaceae bacterium]